MTWIIGILVVLFVIGACYGVKYHLDEEKKEKGK